MVHSLVTGGAGFIGSHLTERLLAQGDTVTVVDDLSTGSLENLAHFRTHRALKVVVGTVLDPQCIKPLVTRATRVFHLAAAVGVDLIVRKPAEAIRTNIVGTDTVLQACAENLTPLFLASTSEVYGKSDAIPFDEQSDIVLGSTSRCRWSYACSKAIDEFMALAYWREHGLPIVVGRFFNTTGPRQTGRYGMVVPRFVNQALKGEDITVYGSGNQTRCFAHVADIVGAVAALIEAPQAFGEVVNLGTTECVSIRELAELVREMTGSTSKIVSVPFEQAYADGFEDIEARVPDVSKARRLIGFAPKHDLHDILRGVIAATQECPPEGV